MDFDYEQFFKSTSPEAYERLLLDVMAGDATLFMRRDSVEASWNWISPILDRWAEPATVRRYRRTGRRWGPPEADGLIEPPAGTGDVRLTRGTIGPSPRYTPSGGFPLPARPARARGQRARTGPWP